MNIKQIVQIETKVNDWVSHFHIANDTPLDILENMTMQLMQYWGKCKEFAANQAAQAQNQQQENQSVSSENPEEEKPEGDNVQ